MFKDVNERMNKSKRPKAKRQESDEESAGSIADFIEDTDSNDSDAIRGKQLLRELLPERHYSDEDDESGEDSGGMEAGYDTLEEEENHAALIADYEDEQEQQNIIEDRIQEKRFREQRLKEIKRY